MAKNKFDSSNWLAKKGVCTFLNATYIVEKNPEKRTKFAFLNASVATSQPTMRYGVLLIIIQISI